ncbi:Nn.00g050750.m01.CDS01 [Neocucurbitaria sp. VM-36]
MRLAIFAIISLATAQQNIADPITDFCRRYQHQTCVIDSKLYIDGGLVIYGGTVNNDSVPERNTWLIWEDLSNLASGLPPQYSNLTKGSEIPTVSGGVLWADQANKLFYLYGGEYYDADVQDFTTLWFYDTIWNTWNRSISDGSQPQISWPSFGAGAVNDEGIAYYYGGYLSNKSVPRWNVDALMLNSMVSFDMNTKRWANFTSDATPRAEGTLHYIPASDRGMLVYFGGVEQLSNGSSGYADMSQVHVLDIASGRWYTQTATGEVPQARRAFCAGVTWAEDHSSYNIYIFGGIGADETALGDLYILSLPSFKWISATQWFPDPQLTTFPGGKAWASCNVINRSQMIIMSGKYTNTSRVGCDVENAGGQHGLLLGQESIEQGNQWHGLMANVSDYRVPGNITAIIGGGTDGKATATAPVAGWATSDLAVYFKTTYSAASRVATRSLPATTSAITIGSPSATSSTPPSGGSSSKTNIGAIVGGVIGGIAALISVILLAFFCLRSRRRKRNSQPPPTAQHSSPSTYQQAPTTAEKSIAGYSASQGSTLHSPNAQTAYSPQGSPPPPSHSSTYYQDSPLQQQQAGADWNQQGAYGYAGQQTYYPPPPDPSQSPGGRSGYTLSVELPSVRSPANAELPDVRSPVPVRGN